MNTLLFQAPPLPHFMTCGLVRFERGQSHPSRRVLGFFDLLLVKEGCLFMGEEDQQYTVQNGQALILLPDRYHYATQPCTIDTSFFWLHFQTSGTWLVERQGYNVPGSVLHLESHASSVSDDPNTVSEPFVIQCAQFNMLTIADSIYTMMETLVELQKHPQASARWKQQLVFQQVLQEMCLKQISVTEPTMQVAEMTATFLRSHYQESFSYALLKEHLHFHPNYLSRCMQRVFGCTPLQYLLNWRIEQAKSLLLNTNLTIGQIANEVGFSHHSYFIRCFTQRVGITPQTYRKHFIM